MPGADGGDRPDLCPGSGRAVDNAPPDAISAWCPHCSWFVRFELGRLVDHPLETGDEP